MKPGKIRRVLLNRMAWIEANRERNEAGEKANGFRDAEFEALKTILEAGGLYDEERYSRYLADARDRLEERDDS